MKSDDAAVLIPALVGKVHLLSYLAFEYFVATCHTKSLGDEYHNAVEILTSALHRLEIAAKLSLVDLETEDLEDSLQKCQQVLRRTICNISTKTIPLDRNRVWQQEDTLVREDIEFITAHGHLVQRLLPVDEDATSAPTKSEVVALRLSQAKRQLLARIASRKGYSAPRQEAWPGTGSWFLNSAEYTTWRDEPDTPRLLWCHGPNGVGKSVLASLAVSDLSRQHRAGACVAHYLHDKRSNPQRTSTVAMLLTILRQLIRQGDQDVVGVVSKVQPAVLRSSHRAVLESVIFQICDLGRPVYFILDGEDEMDPFGRHSASSFFRKMQQAHCRILITNESPPPVTNGITVLRIHGSEEDMSTFLRGSIAPRTELQGAAPDLVDDLIARIVSKSGGLFLVAKLLLDCCLDEETVEGMLLVIPAEPWTLRDAFEASFERIALQPSNRRRWIHRVFLWIPNLTGYITASALIHAVTIDNRYSIDGNVSTRQMLVEAGKGLLVVNVSGDRVRLCHAALMPLLARFGTARQAQDDIYRTALRYLHLLPLPLTPASTAEDLKLRFETLPFLDFAAKECFIASRRRQAAELELTHGLLLPSPSRRSLVQAMFLENDFEDMDLAQHRFEALPKLIGPLHVTSYVGLGSLTKRYVSQGYSLHSVDSHGSTALHWAASAGDKDVIESLHKYGADVDATDARGWTPLVRACYTGSSSSTVVKLLKCGANPDVPTTKRGWTAIHYAAQRRCGHTDPDLVVNFLQKCAYNHLRPRMESSMRVMMPAHALLHPFLIRRILHMAFFDEVADRLGLQCDATRKNDYVRMFQAVDLPSGKREGPVTFTPDDSDESPPFLDNFVFPVKTPMKKVRAPQPKDVKVVSFRRAYLVAQRPDCWREVLLQNAILTGNLVDARLMIELGARPAPPAVAERSATATATVTLNTSTPATRLLHDAARACDRAFVDLLWEAGFRHVAAVDASGSSALHEAVRTGCVASVEALVGYGADLEAPDRLGRRPLHVAVLERHGGVAMALVAAGADVGAPDGFGKTPLHYAAEVPDHLALWLLVRDDAALVQDNHGYTPLHLAVKCGHLDFVTVVLAEGGQGGGGTGAAARRLGTHLRPCSQRLPDSNGNFSPLHSAVTSACARYADNDSSSDLPIGNEKKMLALVLNSNVDRSLSNFAGETALHRAVQVGRLGRIDVVCMLLGSGVLEPPSPPVRSWVDFVDAYGRTALDYADARNGVIADALRRHGARAAGSGHIGNQEALLSIEVFNSCTDVTK